jgi:hypothetical protein
MEVGSTQAPTADSGTTPDVQTFTTTRDLQRNRNPGRTTTATRLSAREQILIVKNKTGRAELTVSRGPEIS